MLKNLESLHIDISVEDVNNNTGFGVLISDHLTETPEPTDEELRVLRDYVDPDTREGKDDNDRHPDLHLNLLQEANKLIATVEVGMTVCWC